jgi:hypothetical protein
VPIDAVERANHTPHETGRAGFGEARAEGEDHAAEGSGAGESDASSIIFEEFLTMH